MIPKRNKARLRDIDAVARWMNNAFSVNDAFGGVIKPDYTGFHHKAICKLAYVPQTLPTGGFAKYLLHGTEFSPSKTSVTNYMMRLYGERDPGIRSLVDG